MRRDYAGYDTAIIAAHPHGNTRHSSSSSAVLKTLHTDLRGKELMMVTPVLRRIPKRVPASVHRMLSSKVGLSDTSYEQFKTLAVTKPASAVFQVSHDIVSESIGSERNIVAIDICWFTCVQLFLCRGR